MHLDPITRLCIRCKEPFTTKSKAIYCSTRCAKYDYWDQTLPSLADYVWSRIVKSDGCWECQGARSPRGYGKMKVRGKDWRAHRLVWTLVNGPIPEGIEVCHTCDNPPCCRPDHLFLGTTAVNSADMVAKGRSLKGDLSPSRAHPESRPRGDRNGSRTHPERLKRGDENSSRLHPERLARGDKNGARLHPERMAKGEKNGSSKLTYDQAREILTRYRAGGISQDALGREYGVSQVAVSLIIRRVKWKHID